MSDRVRPLLAFLVCTMLSIQVRAAPPYDERADPRLELQQALAAAEVQHKNVLVIFGANWCEDCRRLDQALHGANASLIESHFVLVKVDVGNFDRHLDIAQRYGDPIRNGIPAVVVVSAADQVLYSTRAGELAHARRIGESGLYEFFSRVIAASD